MKNFMSKLKIQYFNMVEIVLALAVVAVAVVAVAIVSLMGMLPVALRASKNSVADNSVASVVEIMKSFVDRRYRNNNDFSTFQGKFVKAKLTSSSDTVLKYGDSNEKYPSASLDLENYAFQITNGDINGTYRVELFSGKFDSGKFAVTDFDADVRVWYDKLDGGIYIPIHTANIDYEKNFYKKGGTYEVPLTHACTFYIEVSWPSGIKYENQEHRLYKFDYFKRMD